MRQTPIRDGTTNEQLALRTERYFYDGARRIQDVATESIVVIDPEPQGPGGGGGGLTLAEEMELLEGEGTPNIFVDREYVYVPSGAGVGGGYVDVSSSARSIATRTSGTSCRMSTPTSSP